MHFRCVVETSLDPTPDDLLLSLLIGRLRLVKMGKEHWTALERSLELAGGGIVCCPRGRLYGQAKSIYLRLYTLFASTVETLMLGRRLSIGDSRLGAVPTEL